MQIQPLAPAAVRLSWHGQLVPDEPAMVGQLALGVVDAVEPPEHAGEIGLPARQIAGQDPGRRPATALNPRCLRLMTAWVLTSSR
jgi:hypothetical protein